jgi:hypothetical protein
MKTYKVVINGEAPSYIKEYAEKYNGKPVTKNTFFCLDQDIDFIVCDLQEAHGNVCKADKSAWLTDKNGAWNINIEAN